jgi:hypothetical protein
MLVTLPLLYAAPSAHPRTYSFSANDQYLTQANDYPLWAALMTRHAAQSVEIDACIDVANVHRAEGLLRVELSGRDLSPERRSARQPLSIADAGTSNHAATRLRTGRLLQFGGDCEDYAIAKYFVLRQLASRLTTCARSRARTGLPRRHGGPLDDWRSCSTPTDCRGAD